MCQVSANTIVNCFDVGVSSSPSNKTICSFFSTFPFIAGYGDLEYKQQYDIQVCRVSSNTIVSCFDVGMSSSPSNKTISSFLGNFLLLLAMKTLNVNNNMIFKCLKLIQILSSVVLMWVCLPCPVIRPFFHFLVHFLLLLSMETLNVNDNMIFKCVKLVQILSSVVLMWACLPHPAIRLFLHFLVHFLLLLAMENLNVNDNMIFKCVKLVQILSSVVLM